MKGTYVVRKVVDQGTLGHVLSGSVISGQLKKGMEARYGSIIIIIGDLLSFGPKKKVITKARKGQKVLIIPKLTVIEVLKAVEGAELEFEDIRSEPIKEGLLLKPDLI